MGKPPNHPMFYKGFPLFSPSILGTPIFGNIHIQQITRGPMERFQAQRHGGNCKIFGSGFGSFVVSQAIQKLIHSLKLTCSHLKMDGWNTIVSFWDSIFSGAFTVSFRESTGWVQNISEFYEDYIIKVPYSKIVRITFSYCYQVLGKPQDTG